MKKPVICTVCLAEQSTGVKVDTSKSKTQWARDLGVDESSIRRHLKHPPRTSAISEVTATSEIREEDEKGKRYEAPGDRTPNLDDWRAWIESTGDNPDDYIPGIRSTKRTDGTYWNQLKASRKTAKPGAITMPPADEMLAVIDAYRPTITINKGFSHSTFVVCAADFQIGKTDYGNGTEDTIRRVLDSFAKAAQYAEKHAFKEIVLTDLGDIVENFCNTSSQRGTNDRALTEQIRIARRLMLQAVLMFAPLTEKLTYLAIPSNHGSVRLGPKSPENHVLDDYGIEIAEQIRDVAEHSDKLQNLQVIIPEVSMESLSYTTQDGTTLGLVHGHQASNPNGLSKWWAGQDHGRMPTAGADILLVGHYHSLKVEQSGDARWIFVCPASEVGSSWFRNKTGQDSKSGILTMTVNSGQWSNLVIQ